MSVKPADVGQARVYVRQRKLSFCALIFKKDLLCHFQNFPCKLFVLMRFVCFRRNVFGRSSGGRLPSSVFAMHFIVPFVGTVITSIVRVTLAVLFIILCFFGVCCSVDANDNQSLLCIQYACESLYLLLFLALPSKHRQADRLYPAYPNKAHASYSTHQTGTHKPQPRAQ